MWLPAMNGISGRWRLAANEPYHSGTKNEMSVSNNRTKITDFIIWFIIRILLPLTPLFVTGSAKALGFDAIDFVFPNETIVLMGFVLPIVVAKDVENRHLLWIVVLTAFPGLLLYTFALFAKAYAPKAYLPSCWVGTVCTVLVVVASTIFQWRQK